MKYLFQALSVALTLCISPAGQATETPMRVVSLGGSITEIVYALDAQDLLVGVDQSSLYPPQAQTLPSVGYYRHLPSEGVVSLKPTLVLASANAGPPQVIEQIKRLGIDVMPLSDEPTVNSLEARVRAIAKALDRQAQGEALLSQFRTAWDLAHTKSVPALSATLLIMRGGRLLAAGGDTTAHVVLSESGLENIFSEQRSYQPISAEALNAQAPEVIIVTTSTVNAMGNLDAIKTHPALRLTPAVRDNRIVVLDDLLAQGFGLRVTEAIHTIRQGAWGD